MITLDQAHRRLRRLALVFGGLVVAILMVASGASAFTFTTVDIPGAMFTTVQGIQGGKIVGLYEGTGRRLHGFMRKPSGKITTIDVPGAQGTVANGMSGQKIVGAYNDSIGGVHGFLLVNGVYTTIDAPFPGTMSTQANGINRAGQIVGVVISFQTGEHGFVRDVGGTYTQIDPPGSVHADAYGISKAGKIVGSFTGLNGTHGFVAGP